MPLYWREKTILFKEETTYGVDAVPTGAANAILATDVQLSPMEGQGTSRNLELPWMGAQGTVPTNVHQKLSFRVELKGSGTAGTPPVLGVLLKSCAFAEVTVASVSVTYNRVTSAMKSATIYLNIDGTSSSSWARAGRRSFRSTPRASSISPSSSGACSCCRPRRPSRR